MLDHRTEKLSTASLSGMRGQLVQNDPESVGFVQQPDGSYRVKNLVIARESDEFALQLLEGMILQTLHRCPDLPGVAHLTQVGVDPVREPNKHGGVVIQDGDTKAVLFQHEGTWCLYSRGSAAKADSGGDNGYCRILAAVLDELRPSQLRVATFSRLVRNAEFAGRVLTACEKNVEIVDTHEIRLPMGTPMARMMFQMLAMFSDMERSQQSLRLILGLLAKHDRGEFWHGRRAVPLGYVLRDARAVPDPRARHVVTALLEAMAAPGATAQSVWNALRPFDVASPDQTGGGWAFLPAHGGEWGPEHSDMRDNVAGARASGQSIDTLAYWPDMLAKFRKWLSVYERGVLPTSHEVPAGMLRIGAHPVVQRRGKRKRGMPEAPLKNYVDLEYRLDVVEGGWAALGVFVAAAERSDEIKRRSRGPVTKDVVAPLTAGRYEWQDGHRLYALRKHDAGHYSVMSVALDVVEALGRGRGGIFEGWNREGRQRGRIEGRVLGTELHKSIADTAVRALHDGVGILQVAGPDAWQKVRHAALAAEPDDPVSLAEHKLEKAKRHAERSRELYTRYDGHDEEEERALLLLSEQATREATRAKADLSAARQEKASPSPVEAPLVVDAPADLLVETLVRLGGLADRVPWAAALSVAKVVRDFSATVSDDGLWVDWQCTLHVPAEGGRLEIGPLTGRVVERSRKGANTSAQQSQDRDVLERILGGTERLPDLLPGAGKHGLNQRRRLQQLLVADYGMPMSTTTKLLTCVVDETRKAVWDLMHGRQSTNVDTQFGAHLKRVYLDEPVTDTSAWYQHSRNREKASRVLLEHGGRIAGCSTRTILRKAGLPEDLLVGMAAGDQPFLVRSDTGRRIEACCQLANCSRTDELTLIPCPHCGGWASLSVAVPEVPTAVLCPDCRRMPTVDSPFFPEEYVTLDADTVEERLRTVCPDVLNSRRQYAVATGKAEKPFDDPVDEAEFWAWADRHNVEIDRSRAVPKRHIKAFRDHRVRQAAAAASGPVPHPVPGTYERTPVGVRAWASANSLPVSVKGRLAHSVWQAFDDAHSRGAA